MCLREGKEGECSGFMSSLKEGMKEARVGLVVERLKEVMLGGYGRVGPREQSVWGRKGGRVEWRYEAVV